MLVSRRATDASWMMVTDTASGDARLGDWFHQLVLTPHDSHSQRYETSTADRSLTALVVGGQATPRAISPRYLSGR